MPRITYVAFDGRTHVAEVPVGSTVMRGAVDNGIPGIDGDCGGQCACATCHVFVDPAWLGRTGPRTSSEEDMLGFAAGTEENSRLGCQIEVTADLDGLVVRMPEGQH
jgi:ferredoxin, 2Fe-2S